MAGFSDPDHEVKLIVEEGQNYLPAREKANSFAPKRADFSNVHSRFDQLYNKRIDYSLGTPASFNSLPRQPTHENSLRREMSQGSIMQHRIMSKGVVNAKNSTSTDNALLADKRF